MGGRTCQTCDANEEQIPNSEGVATSQQTNERLASKVHCGTVVWLKPAFKRHHNPAVNSGFHFARSDRGNRGPIAQTDGATTALQATVAQQKSIGRDRKQRLSTALQVAQAKMHAAEVAKMEEQVKAERQRKPNCENVKTLIAIDAARREIRDSKSRLMPFSGLRR
jgi:hypothetical protein